MGILTKMCGILMRRRQVSPVEYEILFSPFDGHPIFPGIVDAEASIKITIKAKEIAARIEYVKIASCISSPEEGCVLQMKIFPSDLPGVQIGSRHLDPRDRSTKSSDQRKKTNEDPTGVEDHTQ